MYTPRLPPSSKLFEEELFGPERRSPLLVATMLGDGRMVKLLLAKCPALLEGCDVDGNNALHTAVIHERFNVLQILVKAGAAINERNYDDYTPLQLSALAHKTNFVVFLRKHGATTDLDEPSDHVASMISDLGHMERGFAAHPCAKPVGTNTRDFLLRHGSYASTLRSRRQAVDDFTDEVSTTYSKVIRQPRADGSLDSARSYDSSSTLATASSFGGSVTGAFPRSRRGSKRGNANAGGFARR